MKVICKSNNYIAIPTKDKAKCLYMLGQYLNKETCKIEMGSDEVSKITCRVKAKESSWRWNIELTTELPYDAHYIILDMSGNLVNVVSEEQFEQQYAILQDDSKKDN